MATKGTKGLYYSFRGKEMRCSGGEIEGAAFYVLKNYCIFATEPVMVLAILRVGGTDCLLGNFRV